ncbi:hypothetical protein VTJ04DRAFT_9618 [Mycothermus thermophilus]|uniref:uncharacterized protein n=1 Tax=Humicola insolens TaxID=85995 RepID=UPI0037423EF7
MVRGIRIGVASAIRHTKRAGPSASCLGRCSIASKRNGHPSICPPICRPHAARAGTKKTVMTTNAIFCFASPKAFRRYCLLSFPIP